MCNDLNIIFLIAATEGHEPRLKILEIFLKSPCCSFASACFFQEYVTISNLHF